MKMPGMHNRVCHLSSVHPALDVRIFYKEARTLAKAGYSVTVAARHAGSDKGDGVKILGIPKVANRCQRFLVSTWRVFVLACGERADVYHLHDAELIPAGILLKLLRKHVIYDVHEDLPRQLDGKHWIPSWIRGPLSIIVEMVEALAARLFDRIIAATPAIAQRFPAQKTVLVQNYPILGELGFTQSNPYASRPPSVAFVGGISAIRGAREMVQAIGLVPDDMHAELILAGSLDPVQLDAELQQLPGWQHTKFMGWLSREQVRALLGQVRAGLVLFHPLRNHIKAQPNKLFEYMSAGVPVIASDFPLWREIIGGTNCGLVVDPLVPEAIAEAITWLLNYPEEAEAMGRRGQEAVRTRYNWDVEARKLLQAYSELLA